MPNEGLSKQESNPKEDLEDGLKETKRRMALILFQIKEREERGRPFTDDQLKFALNNIRDMLSSNIDLLNNLK